MSTKGNWNKVLEIADRGFDFSVQDTLLRSWEVYRLQPFAFGGFTVMIFLAMLLALVFGQLGQMLANIILLPCLLVGFATFTHALITGKATEAGKTLFAGFNKMLSLGLIGMAINLLMTAALAPTLIILNQMGLQEMLISFQETQDFAVFELDFSLLQKMVILLNFLFAIYFMVALSWSSLLTYYENLPFYRAIEGSRRLITKRWWKFFGLFLSLILIYILAFFAISFLSSLLGPIFAFFGGIGIILGLLIAIPMIFISSYLVFHDCFNEMSIQNEEEIPIT